MKFALALILCSYVAESCLPPYVYPTKFEDQYDCFVEGYKQSMVKMEEISPYPSILNGSREVSGFTGFRLFSNASI